MSFINCQPDLTGTVYSIEHLEFARKYLTEVIKQHDRFWLDNPRGPLGALWCREDTSAICHLISVANLLYFLRERITQSSLEILQEKIKTLLNLKSNKQFDETLTELQIAHELSCHVSPLEFEPCVPKNIKIANNNKPKSPDFSIKLPDGNVHLDATVFHIDILDQWNASIGYIRKKVMDATKN